LKKFLLLILITAIAAGCKYEDGPLISFRSSIARLYGNHILTKYTVDGVDNLDLYYDSLSLNFHLYWDSVVGRNICDMHGGRKDGGMSNLVWTWELLNKNRNLKVLTAAKNYSGGSCGPFRNNRLPNWHILKLNHKDIIMQTTYNDKTYLIELK
jgi:hypothetical protein